MFDLIILGSGPAGLTASIYASRYKLSHVVIGKLLGGTITYATKVENYPGYNSISGVELAQKIGEQVKNFGVEIVTSNVGKIETIGDDGPTSPAQSGLRGVKGFRVFGENGQTWEAKTVIMATGTERRKLGIQGETEYLGKGVSYCTTCDVPFFRNKIVVTVGGSDAAVSGAIHAAEFAREVYLIYRGESLRAEPVWVEEALKNPKIKIIYKTNVVKLIGNKELLKGSTLVKVEPSQDVVGAVELDNPYNNSTTLPTDGIFIEIGGIPGTSLVVPLGVKLDKNGFVDVNSDMSTNVPGFFTAGDITDEAQVLVQMTTACAQGAIAAASAYKFLKGQKPAQIQGI